MSERGTRPRLWMTEARGWIIERNGEYYCLRPPYLTERPVTDEVRRAVGAVRRLNEAYEKLRELVRPDAPLHERPVPVRAFYAAPFETRSCGFIRDTVVLPNLKDYRLPAVPEHVAMHAVFAGVTDELARIADEYAARARRAERIDEVLQAGDERAGEAARLAYDFLPEATRDYVPALAEAAAHLREAKPVVEAGLKFQRRVDVARLPWTVLPSAAVFVRERARSGRHVYVVVVRPPLERGPWWWALAVADEAGWTGNGARLPALLSTMAGLSRLAQRYERRYGREKLLARDAMEELEHLGE